MTTNAHKPDPLIYLASPYSHKDKEVRHFRYRANMITVAEYLHQGIYLFSPILHAHPIACYRDLGSADEWLRYDFAVLGRCDALWVLSIEGWQYSSGVAQERKFAHEHNIPVKYISAPLECYEAMDEFKDFEGPQGRV